MTSPAADFQTIPPYKHHSVYIPPITGQTIHPDTGQSGHGFIEPPRRIVLTQTPTRVTGRAVDVLRRHALFAHVFEEVASADYVDAALAAAEAAAKPKAKAKGAAKAAKAPAPAVNEDASEQWDEGDHEAFALVSTRQEAIEVLAARGVPVADLSGADVDALRTLAAARGIAFPNW